MSEFKEASQIIFWDKQSTCEVSHVGVEDCDVNLSWIPPVDGIGERRIDNDLGDDFPIENHISPNCEVKNL